VEDAEFLPWGDCADSRSQVLDSGLGRGDSEPNWSAPAAPAYLEVECTFDKVSTQRMLQIESLERNR
jgi:hypothetical protein